MREAASSVTCGAARAVTRTSTPPLEIALRLGHEVTGYVSLRWDNEARDWICVETGGVPAEARLRCHCCALAAPSLRLRCAFGVPFRDE